MHLRDIEPPKILYKYRSVSDRSISMLQENKIYFANPNDFNDPFDCKAQGDQVQNFREAMENHIRSNGIKKGFPKEQIEADIEAMKQDPIMTQLRTMEH
jgi:hypothetical protein